MKRLSLVAILLCAAVAAPGAHAQPAKPGEDPLARLFFPPEFVVQFGKLISLESAQRSEIVKAIKEAQGDLVDLQLQMAELSEELMKLVAPLRVDEAAVLEKVDRVLALERDMKRRQMQLLIRIKNGLSKEQQERLNELRKMKAATPEQEAELQKYLNALPGR